MIQASYYFKRFFIYISLSLSLSYRFSFSILLSRDTISTPTSHVQYYYRRYIQLIFVSFVCSELNDTIILCNDDTIYFTIEFFLFFSCATENIKMASTSSPISDFFRGRHVLITGGTGFMGKVLVEKLLHSCPNIGLIYLLIRPKQGHDVKSRLDQLLNAAVK